MYETYLQVMVTNMVTCVLNDCSVHRDFTERSYVREDETTGFLSHMSNIIPIPRIPGFCTIMLFTLYSCRLCV